MSLLLALGRQALSELRLKQRIKSIPNSCSTSDLIPRRQRDRRVSLESIDPLVASLRRGEFGVAPGEVIRYVEMQQQCRLAGKWKGEVVG